VIQLCARQGNGEKIDTGAEGEGRKGDRERKKKTDAVKTGEEMDRKKQTKEEA